MLWWKSIRAGVRPADAARPYRSNPDYQASETGDDRRRNCKEIPASGRGGPADLEGNRRPETDKKIPPTLVAVLMEFF